MYESKGLSELQRASVALPKSCASPDPLFTVRRVSVSKRLPPRSSCSSSAVYVCSFLCLEVRLHKQSTATCEHGAVREIAHPFFDPF